MQTYICNQCGRAFYGPAIIETRHLRLLLFCPGCGCHRFRRASKMEARIVEEVLRQINSHKPASGLE